MTKPVIPISLVDSVTQRQFVLAIFVGIQAIKYFQLLNATKEFNSSWISLFTGIEICFFIFVWLLRIPKFDKISLFRWICLFVLFFTINFATFTIMFHQIKVSIYFSEGELTRFEETIVKNQAFVRKDVINGKLDGTVRISKLGRAKAIFNREKKTYCIPSFIPLPNGDAFSPSNYVKSEYCGSVELSGEGPWTVEYTHTDNYGETVINSVEMKSHTECIEIKKVGNYSLFSVKDAHLNAAKILENNPVIVVPCPEIRIEKEMKNDICAGEDVKATFWLRGSFAPLTGLIERVTNDESFLFEVVAHEVQDSILNPEFVKKEVELGIFEDPGQILLKAKKVYDKNSIEYDYGLIGDSRLITVHSLPLIKDIKCSRFISGKGTITLTLMNFVDRVTIDILDPTGQIQTIVMTKDVHQIPIFIAGVYRVTSMKSEFCNPIAVALECSTESVLPPTIEYNFETLVGKCSLDSGVVAHFSLTGTSPWFAVIKEERLSQGGSILHTEQHNIHIRNHQHSHSFHPNVPGIYRYSVVKFSDQNFQENVADTKPHKIQLHPLPDANFPKERTNTKCLGAKERVPVYFSGEAPFKFSIQTVFPDGTKKRYELSSDSLTYTFETEPLSMPGDYSVALDELIDKSGCKITVDKPEYTFKVSRFIPSVSWIAKERDILIKENGSKRIPLKIVGEPPFLISGLRNGANEVNFNTDIHEITVNSPGDYELRSIKDKYCFGNGFESVKFKVTVVEKPNAVFSQYKELHKCQDQADDTLDAPKIKLSGSAPFKIQYRLIHFNENGILQADVTKELIEMKEHEVLFPLKSLKLTAAGIYEIKLAYVSDSNYHSKVSLSDSVGIKYKIARGPYARFKDAKPRYVCNSTTAGEGIAVLLEGKAPFILKYEMIDERGSVVSKEVKENILDSEYIIPLKEFKHSGHFSCRIASVTDSSQCSFSGEKIDQSISIQVVESPSIEPVLEKPYYVCVSESVYFKLGGAGPWKIKYQFNSETVNERTVYGNQLVLHTEMAGTMKILSICNSFCCRDDFIEITIRDLPSARINEGGNQIKDVKEGDFVYLNVTLQGISPFSFSYQHISGASDSIVETYTVENIVANHHVIRVDQEGIFQLISVTDRYCRYPKLS